MRAHTRSDEGASTIPPTSRAVLFVAGCGDRAGPETGPVFTGTVRVADQAVAGSLVEGVAASSCSSSQEIARGSATTSAAGAYEMVLPMDLRTSGLCVKLTASKKGAQVASVTISGFNYETEGQRYTANLDERRRIIIRPSP